MTLIQVVQLTCRIWLDAGKWKKSVTSGKDGDCNGANGQPDGMVGIEDLGKLLALWKK